jgi:hypothetical protein
MSATAFPEGAAPTAPRQHSMGTSATLAARQAELVAALVAGAPTPAGFDETRIAATRRALLRKRAGEAARAWPLLAAALGAGWSDAFAADRTGTEPTGGLRDGWDVARALRARGELPAAATGELREREAALRYDGTSAPRPRRLAAVQRLLARVTR